MKKNLLLEKNTSDKEKFDKWAYTVPFTVGNPLFHWTHLELERYFDIKMLLQPSTSNEIFEETNHQLKTLLPKQLLKDMRLKCYVQQMIQLMTFHPIKRFL